MGVAEIQVPVSLLLDRDLSPAAKVVWLAARVHSRPVPPTTLAAASGLTLATVRKSLARLETVGWYSPAAGALERSPGAKVSIPAGLVAERRVRPQAKLTYGLLQTMPTFRDKSGEFTYSALGVCAQISGVTVRQVIRELAETGWIQTRQANQLAPVWFTLRTPDLDRSAAELAQAMHRLEEAEYRGEEIMREFLSLLIDSDEYEDNARPGFLVNPLTNERMELDRYYPPVAAFEFNGPQHYRTTERFPSEQALAMQQARDLMKEALCQRRGVRVVVINPPDLTYEKMKEKVGDLMPLRDLRGHEALLAFLDKAGKAYHY